MPVYKYQDVVKSFADKNCSLLTTEKEFDTIQSDISKFNKTSSKKQYPQFKYTASCGCKSMVYFNVFRNRGTGVICPKCTSTRNAQNKKDENVGITNIYNELNCINYFTELVKKHFEIVKCFDGCKCDIAYRPINVTNDVWCGIQVKTTNVRTRDYSFHLTKKDYTNLIMLCICFVDKKMWAIPYDIVKGKMKITIGLKKSKYNIYEVTKENIIDRLTQLYDNGHKFEFETLDTPQNIYQIREQEYRKYREKMLNFIKFEDNGMEGLVWDFKIGEKRIQEKVGCLPEGRKKYKFCLFKNNGKINKICTFTQYKSGDNEIYWLNCEGKKYFYVIPQKILKDNDLIDNEKKSVLLCNPCLKNVWYNEYLFDYENIDKEKLLRLIEE